jgi:outer membrane protein, multidrug efflux system
MLGRRLGSWLLLGVMTSFVSGCFVTPEPIKPASFDKRIATDRQELFSAQEPVNPNRPISLEEAVARTLKYNLDHRVAAMEQALALGQADVSQFDLLPAVIASAGYAGRDKQKASSSRNTDTLQQSLTTSTSEDRSTKNFDLSFTWNILDFGVSYYQAHQDANRVLIAEENRRRVFQNLVADIRDAYWRAAGAQLMKAEVDKILEDVKGPIAKSREVVAKSLLPPLPILREHKNLINILSQLEALRLEADLATAKLAFLMGLERGTKFKLVDLNEDRLALPKLVIANRSAADLGPAKALSALENMALRGRSELRQELYNERIDAAETKKAMLRLLPGLEISAAHNVDTNSFLANQTWGDLGVKVTFNLFNLLKGRSNINFAET